MVNTSITTWTTTWVRSVASCFDVTDMWYGERERIYLFNYPFVFVCFSVFSIQHPTAIPTILHHRLPAHLRTIAPESGRGNRGIYWRTPQDCWPGREEQSSKSPRAHSGKYPRLSGSGVMINRGLGSGEIDPLSSVEQLRGHDWQDVDRWRRKG